VLNPWAVPLLLLISGAEAACWRLDGAKGSLKSFFLHMRKGSALSNVCKLSLKGAFGELGESFLLTLT